MTAWEDDFNQEMVEVYYPGSSKKIPPAAVSPPKPPEPAGWDAEPRTGLRNGREYEFFTIRHLAAAVNRKPVTIRSWETRGYLPLSGQRSESLFPDKRHRLYTRPQIEGIALIAEQEGILHESVPRIGSTNFTRRVLDLFIELAQQPHNGAVPLNEDQ